MRRMLIGALWIAALPMGMAGQVVMGSVGSSAARPVHPVKPYAMTQNVTVTRSYGDGLMSTMTSKLVVLRDSQGRTRNEREQAEVMPTKYIRDGRVSHSVGREGIRSISVYDPVDRLTLNWSEGGGGLLRQVNVNRIPEPMTSAVPLGGLRDAPPVRQPAAHAQAQGGDELTSESQTERLGQRAIQGLIAEGTRVTTKYSAGVYGMNREFSIVREDWLAVDYHIVVESTTDDPRVGKSVTTLVTFTDGDPDPAMFKAPAGYKQAGNAKAEETVEKP